MPNYQIAVNALNLEAKTFEIVTKNELQGIKCLCCQMISYNPNDIEYKYCGNCHQFHPITQLR